MGDISDRRINRQRESKAERCLRKWWSDYSTYRRGGGGRDKFSKIAKDQIVRNKLAALNFTLKTWSPDGEFEAEEERPPDGST